MLRFETPSAGAESKSPAADRWARSQQRVETFYWRKVQSVENETVVNHLILSRIWLLVDSLEKHFWSANDSSVHSTCRTKRSKWTSWWCRASSCLPIHLPFRAGTRKAFPGWWDRLTEAHWWWEISRSSAPSHFSVFFSERLDRLVRHLMERINFHEKKFHKIFIRGNPYQAIALVDHPWWYLSTISA